MSLSDQPGLSLCSVIVTDLVAAFENYIVKEALRIGKVADHCLSLVAPEDNLHSEQWLILAG